MFYQVTVVSPTYRLINHDAKEFLRKVCPENRIKSFLTDNGQSAGRGGSGLKCGQLKTPASYNSIS